MIIFNRDKYLADIKKNGIGATDYYAKQKLQYYMEYLIFHTSYKKHAIIDKVRKIAASYFEGLPDSIVYKELESLYLSITENPKEDEGQKKILTLYESEMRKIVELEDDRLMRLAFATLVLHKFCGQYIDNGITKYHGSVRSCDADIYRVADMNNLSGTKKNQLWQQLSSRNMVRFFPKINSAFRFHSDWIAMTLFTVPFNVDLKEHKEDEAVFMHITNYDNLLFYLYRYLGREDIVLCTDCGCPILKTGNAKNLCSDCAVERKKASDRARYLTEKNSEK